MRTGLCSVWCKDGWKANRRSATGLVENMLKSSAGSLRACLVVVRG